MHQCMVYRIKSISLCELNGNKENNSRRKREVWCFVADGNKKKDVGDHQACIGIYNAT